MSILPDDFAFSQNNLQDYADCPRRFELRHIQRLEWPALQSEPVIELERRAEMGRRFHEMVQQSVLGIPPEKIAASVSDPELAAWWDEFTRSSVLLNLPGLRRAEYTLSMPFEGYRLVAKYDLLSLDPGSRAVIVDWKTSNRPLLATYLANRLQTRVYPFLLATAGAALNQRQPVRPDQLEMIYWFTADPPNPVHFQYNDRQAAADREYLAGLVREIAAHPPGSFPMTPDEKKCAYCVYRSLCDRGLRAGTTPDDLEELGDSAISVEIPFEQIGEIEF